MKIQNYIVITFFSFLQFSCGNENSMFRNASDNSVFNPSGPVSSKNSASANPAAVRLPTRINLATPGVALKVRGASSKSARFEEKTKVQVEARIQSADDFFGDDYLVAFEYSLDGEKWEEATDLTKQKPIDLSLTRDVKFKDERYILIETLSPTRNAFFLRLIVQTKSGKRGFNTVEANLGAWEIYIGRTFKSLDQLSGIDNTLGYGFGEFVANGLVKSKLTGVFYFVNPGIGIQTMDPKNDYLVRTLVLKNPDTSAALTAPLLLKEAPDGRIYFPSSGYLYSFIPDKNEIHPKLMKVLGGGNIDDLSPVVALNKLFIAPYTSFDFDESNRMVLVTTKSDRPSFFQDKSILIFQIAINEEGRATTIKHIIGNGTYRATLPSKLDNVKEIGLPNALGNISNILVSGNGAVIVLNVYPAGLYIYSKVQPQDSDYKFHSRYSKTYAYVVGDYNNDDGRFYISSPLRDKDHDIKYLSLASYASSLESDVAFGGGSAPDCNTNEKSVANACIINSMGYFYANKTHYFFDGAMGNIGGRSASLRQITTGDGKPVISTLAGRADTSITKITDIRQHAFGSFGDLAFGPDGKLYFADSKSLQIYRHTPDSNEIEKYIGNGNPASLPLADQPIASQGLGMGYVWGDILTLGFNKSGQLHLRANATMYYVEDGLLKGFGSKDSTVVSASSISHGELFPFKKSNSVWVNYGFSNIVFDDQNRMYGLDGYAGDTTNILSFPKVIRSNGAHSSPAVPFESQVVAGKRVYDESGSASDPGSYLSNTFSPDGSLASESSIRCSNNDFWGSGVINNAVDRSACTYFPLRHTGKNLMVAEDGKFRWIDDEGKWQPLKTEDEIPLAFTPAPPQVSTDIVNFIISKKRLFFSDSKGNVFCSWTGKSKDSPSYCKASTLLGPTPGLPRAASYLGSGLEVDPDGRYLYVSANSLILRYDTSRAND